MEEKKLHEQEYIRRLWLALGESPDDWSLEPGERPDVIARHKSGRTLGIEVTEILSTKHGRDRNYDWVASAIHCDGVRAWVTACGGTGAFVHGTIDCLPSHRREVEPVRAAFDAHLRVHGAGLHSDRGEMWKPFKHAFGRVTHVQRLDDAGFRLYEDGFNPLSHKADLPIAQIETIVLARVHEKVGKALGFDRRQPLWLLLRNRYQHLHGLSDSCLAEVRSGNACVFERVLLLNDREDHEAWGIRSFPDVLDLR